MEMRTGKLLYQTQVTDSKRDKALLRSVQEDVVPGNTLYARFSALPMRLSCEASKLKQVITEKMRPEYKWYQRVLVICNFPENKYLIES